MGAAVGEMWGMRVRGTCHGQRILLTHHYILTDIIGSPDYDVVSAQFLNHLANDVGGSDLIETKLLACMPADYVLDAFEVQLIRPIRLAYTRKNRGTEGMHDETTETANQAAAITLKSAFAGRWAQCTKHIGPIPQGPTTQVNGLLANAYKVKLETLGAALLTPLVTGLFTMSPCIKHPVGVHLGNTPLLTQTIQTEIRVMRRRTVRVGE